MATEALRLKEEGNIYFKKEDYVGAEALYSRAIVEDPHNSALYTNRALARLKLSRWDLVVEDCNSCLEIAPDNMKALYQLSQAQLEMRDYNAALRNAQLARERYSAVGDRSLGIVTSHVLRCRKERWDDKERRRVREERDLEREVLEMMACGRKEAALEVDSDISRKDVDEEWDQKEKSIKAVFDRARADSDRHREVPDWVIDDISFDIMVDPVVTKSGKSYERASILEYLRKHKTDPISREPLAIEDLRPNLDLKYACELFLEQNGWAVDW